MIKDNLHFDAQEKLQAGIKKVARAVGITMGTGGNNALIEAIENPGHLMTNDGYSIANAIVLADPIEDMGRKMVVEAINRANKASGDGSSTTCVLTDAILDEGLKYKDKAHAMDIKRSLEECMPLIEASLDKQTRIIGVKDIAQVASISAEDEGIGKTIAEIYKKIGKKGLIYWDVSKTTEDSYTIGSGITVEGATYISPYMCDATETGQNTNSIRVKEPKILITKQKITSASDFNQIAASLNNDEIKDLIVFADDFEPLMVNDLVLTRAMKGFRIVVIKMPVLWKDWWYEDLAKATGAKIVDPASGFTMKQVTQSDLGTCGNIIVTKTDTNLDGIKDVSDYVKELEADGTDEGKLRASRLNTKTARYFVGAQSDSALSYRRLKVEDAISASYQALNGGIVAGGGVALMNIAMKMPNTIGGEILSVALHRPYNQILGNAGIKNELLLNPNWGYDSKSKVSVDMFDAGIVDPRNVVLNAVKNALSVAASVITAPTIVTLPRMEQDFNISQGNNTIVR